MAFDEVSIDYYNRVSVNYNTNPFILHYFLLITNSYIIELYIHILTFLLKLSYSIMNKIVLFNNVHLILLNYYLLFLF